MSLFASRVVALSKKGASFGPLLAQRRTTSRWNSNLALRHPDLPNPFRILGTLCHGWGFCEHRQFLRILIPRLSTLEGDESPQVIVSILAAAGPRGVAYTAHAQRGTRFGTHGDEWPFLPSLHRSGKFGAYYRRL